MNYIDTVAEVVKQVAFIECLYEDYIELWVNGRLYTFYFNHSNWCERTK